MTAISRLLPVFALICASLLSSSLLSGGTLTGAVVTSQYYAYGEPYVGLGSPASFVSDGSVQQTFCSVCGVGFTLSITENQVIYQFIGGGTWDASEPSYTEGGLYIESGNLLTFADFLITDVSIDPASTVVGFDLSDLTYNSSRIAVNLAGLSLPGEPTLILNVNGDRAVVPEPTAGLFVLGGFMGVWLLRRRAKAQNAA